MFIETIKQQQTLRLFLPYPSAHNQYKDWGIHEVNGMKRIGSKGKIAKKQIRKYTTGCSWVTCKLQEHFNKLEANTHATYHYRYSTNWRKHHKHHQNANTSYEVILHLTQDENL
eukprot:m.195872 g.195872  ORF g.195872 m.195872 type:complete len:114 (+) comp15692_c0_seq24:2066-2407(+)